MIINGFISRLREEECKYSIYDNNRFIYPPPEGGSVNIQFTIIIDLFIPCLKGRSINIQFIIIIDLFTPCFERGECKYLIYNEN